MLVSVVVLTFVVLICWLALNYANFGRLRRSLTGTWSELEGRLKSRHQNISRLIGTMASESDVAKTLARALDKCQNESLTDKQREDQENEIGNLLGQFLQELEQSTDNLKSEDYLKAREMIVSLEDELALLCVRYSELVVSFNLMMKNFPTRLLVGKSNTKELVEFQLSDVFNLYPLKISPTKPTPKKTVP